MAFFKRREREPEPQEAAESELPEVPEFGPFDEAAVPELGSRLDLGSLRLPKVAGMALRLELDRNSKIPMAATVTVGSSAVQLMAFAAPRSGGLWDEVRPELAASIVENGGVTEESSGDFGQEILATMPITTPGGTGTNQVRFVGIDGPRWLVRATFSGPAATDPSAAGVLEDLVRQIVVVRGNQARPPREYLPLEVPGTRQAEEAAGTDALAVPRRGPEMTETR